MPEVVDHGRLSPAQAGAYWDDGYLFPIRVFDAAEAARYRAELEQIESDWLDNGLPQPLLAYKRVNAHVVMPLAFRLASHPAVLDVVEGVLGPDLMIYGAEFFIKEARSRQVVTMHQDLTYWGLGAIDGMVTAWVALSPSTRASGCMDFVRASHKNPILPHADTFAADNLLSRGQEIQVEVRPEDRVAIELMPGEMSLHHGLTIHGSEPNGSDDRRIGFVIRYVTPEVAQRTGDHDYAMPVRGEDRLGHFIHVPPPSALFDPAALALYEEMRAAKAKILMRGAKSAGSVY